MQSRKCWADIMLLPGSIWEMLLHLEKFSHAETAQKNPCRLHFSQLHTLGCKLLLVPPSLACSTVQITKKMTKIEAWFLIYFCFMFAARTLSPAPATAAVSIGVWTRPLSPKWPWFCLPNRRARHSCSSLKPGGREGIISASHTAGSLHLVSISVANCPDRFSTFTMYSALSEPRCSTWFKFLLSDLIKN